MKPFLRTLSFFLIAAPAVFAESPWQSNRLHEKFFSEGASAGDIDGDGRVDLVAGPLWFRGPEFKRSFEIAMPREFPISTYSDQFFSQVFDADGDGANDVLVLGFPGKDARLYLNPGHQSLDKRWEMHSIAETIDNESPAIVDFVPGRLPEIVCGRGGQYGFYSAGTDATQTWNWTPVSRPGTCSGRFAHALGVGDVDGDGRLDILDRTSWWQQPQEIQAGELWQQRTWAPGNYGPGGAQIHVDDFDGDGDSDILSSHAAHGYGLSWFEQTTEQNFVQHQIMGQSSTENDYGIVFSQLHAVALADLDGDGLKDIITGKRHRAHQGKDPGGLQQPVLHWFQTLRQEKGVEFVPRLIHGDSGVGVDVLVTDLNSDNRPDIVSASKRGLTIHLQSGNLIADVPPKWKLTEGRDQSKYADGYSPAEAAKNMMVPEGFGVDLIASEPELTQPVAMCFDARGRIWAIEGHTYPTKAPEGEGKDRVVIFEDSDGNGTFETKKTFATGLNLASGIEIGFGGVWIGAAPELLFIPDADRDDIPDGEPQVLLDGWGYQDTHETLNSFTWGPDGWLYGCQGIFTHSKVGKPGARENQRVPLNACVWRYHPTQHRFEVYAHGTSNPWGVDFNERGDWFVSACVIPHLYHMVQGGRYQRQAGRHFNDSTYDDIKTIADHAHFAGSIRDHAFWGDNKTTKPAAPIGTSVLGGGHAHCGLAIYNGGVFPQRFRDKLLFHNLHGHRVVSESVEPDGSSYIGKHQPDFALARDHKEIGVGVMVGPDGAIYTSDWHDVQTCHNRNTEVWDRTNGRLFRIRYGDVKPYKLDLWSESDDQLLARLKSENGFFARQARRILQERATEKVLNTGEVFSALQTMIDNSDSQRDRLRALWTMWCVGGVDGSRLQGYLRHEDEYVRAWAVHFAGETLKPTRGESLVGTDESPFHFSEYDFRDESPVVRRYLASLLQRMPLENRWQVAESLTSYSVDAHDRKIPLLVWYGFEPLVEADPSRAIVIAQKCSWPNLLRFTIRRMATTPSGRDSLVALLVDPANRGQRLTVLEELDAAVKSRGGLTMPTQWPAAYQTLASAPLPRVRELTRSIAVQFGDKSVLPHFRSILADQGQTRSDRMNALSVLKTSKDAQLPRQLLSLLDDPTIASAAVQSLALFDDPTTPIELLARMSRFDAPTKTAALNTLVSRKPFAAHLVAAMENGTITPTDVPAFIVRQAVAFDDAELNQRLEKVWGRISFSSDDMKAQYAKYRGMLNPKMIAAADASLGRTLYDANCGNCHKLFGVGGDIGPDITGANRTKIDYWLENILEPNALIGKAYQMTSFVMSDGRVVSGIVKSENDDAVTVQTATELVVLRQDEIEQSRASSVSLMPTGQLEPMSPVQVQSLIKYLMSPRQVPRSGPKTPLQLRSADAIAFEGEALSEVVLSAGITRPQGMKGFGPEWSEGSQVWWTGGKPGATMSFTVTPKVSGNFDLVLHLTKANDYATIRVSGDGLPPEEIDLFNPTVVLGQPIRWSNRSVTSGEPIKLKIEITGANPSARPSYMVGIDAVELVAKKKDP